MMIQIDGNSSFFSIRNNERTQGAWNDAQKLVKLSVVDMHKIAQIYTLADQFHLVHV